MTPTYSIIIPHKDIPGLLQRCLDSIPVRDDVEVIVVDDNSDPRKVDFGHFPKWWGKHFKCYLTKEGKGPGFARNVGLDHASGHWIVFADADDFFTADFNALLDEVVDAEEDIVFFDYINVLSDDITTQVEERTHYRSYIAAYLDGDQSEFRLRTDFVAPWCKFVKRNLIEENHIRFDEVMWGEDVYFSGQLGYAAKDIGVSGRIGYVVTTRKGSVMDNFCSTAEDFRVRLIGNLKCDRLFQEWYGPHVRSDSWLGYVCRKKGVLHSAKLCMANIFYPRVFWPTALFLARVAINKLKSLV